MSGGDESRSADRVLLRDARSPRLSAVDEEEDERVRAKAGEAGDDESVFEISS